VTPDQGWLSPARARAPPLPPRPRHLRKVGTAPDASPSRGGLVFSLQSGFDPARPSLVRTWQPTVALCQREDFVKEGGVYIRPAASTATRTSTFLSRQAPARPPAARLRASPARLDPEPNGHNLQPVLEQPTPPSSRAVQPGNTARTPRRDQVSRQHPGRTDSGVAQLKAFVGRAGPLVCLLPGGARLVAPKAPPRPVQKRKN